MRSIFFLQLGIYLIIVLSSCNFNKGKNEEFSLHKSDSIIRLEIPSYMSSITRNLRYFKEKGTEYLAIENMHKEAIEIFNLNNKQYIKQIKPQREGPNGIGARMIGFDIINFDTIFLTTSGYCDKLFLIDSSTSILKRIDFDIYYKPYLPIGDLWSSYGCSSNYDGKRIVLGNVCRATEEEFEEIHNDSIGYIYNFKTDKQSYYPLNHPNKSKEKSKIIYSESFLIEMGDKTIMSYHLGHQIFVSNDKHSWISYNLKSKYVNKSFNPGFGNDMIESGKKFVESPYYLALVYDKYRHVYYRFVYPGIGVTKGDDVMKLSEFRRVFSVMIIDENFNVLGETLMPENTYNSNMFFINEAGLWISTNHPENPDFEEDAINFQLFTLK